LRLRAAGIDLRAARTRRALVEKHRYLADDSKLFKVDEGTVVPLDSLQEEQVAKTILERAEHAAAVIFADFGYGLITGGLLDRVMQPLRQRVPVITADVSGRQSNLLRFRDVDLLCPTEREVRETLHDFSTGINNIVYGLLSKTGAKQALVTLGKQGLIVFDQYRARAAGEAWERKLRSEYLPALATQAIDPLGCGDALLAAASLTLAVGGSVQAAAYLGSVAAAFEVQRVGNQPVTSEDLLAGLALPASVNQQARRLAS
jgi:bifunctional ADP-heptose synthase (sugar kinase/adenylyltransferase)